MFVGKPTKNCLIAISENWTAVSYDGYSLLLKNNKTFIFYFKMEYRLKSIFFSPKGKSLYCLDKRNNIYHIQTNSKKIQKNPNFELLITLMENPKFVNVIPYEKVVYVIQDSYIHVVKDKEIVSTSQLETPVTAICSIPKSFAESNNIISVSNPVPYIVLAGDESGQIYRIAFPGNLQLLENISSPFVSKSDPISHIY